mmetsp:Transcript_70647/g.147123  ORF Transcript_70647/g.147123 Transcript_70647/m.147123 type:complete len:156 (+) Transcript_70647:1425-1892(+)
MTMVQCSIRYTTVDRYQALLDATRPIPPAPGGGADGPKMVDRRLSVSNGELDSRIDVTSRWNIGAPANLPPGPSFKSSAASCRMSSFSQNASNAVLAGTSLKWSENSTPAKCTWMWRPSAHLKLDDECVQLLNRRSDPPSGHSRRRLDTLSQTPK